MSEISKTADNALLVLIELGAIGWAAPQRLATITGLNRTVVQRLLFTLSERNLVLNQGGEYKLAPRLRRLAESVQTDLRHVAETHMTRLALCSHETLVLQVVDGKEAIVLQERRYHDGVRLQARHEVGARSPLTKSASGLAILAAFSNEQIERVVRGNLELNSLRPQLDKVRELGFAETTDDLQSGVSGIATPIRRASGLPQASLAIIAPSLRSTSMRKHTASLIGAARDIEATLEKRSTAAIATKS